MVAIRTVLNEAYANGEITSHVFDNGNALHEFEVGSNMGTNATRFEIGLISYFATEEDYDTYARRAAALIGEAFPADSTAALEERTWHYSAVAQRGVGATAATADGFVFSLSPEGADIGLPEIVVTYKINAINEPTRIGDIVNPSSNVSYDPNAGYEVYHFMPQ
ncbi:MAG: Dabb family protein [Clostridiales Family XIII bacterium]|nr:Dabb family protein [Clostridiales Family XIII bacterium]